MGSRSFNSNAVTDIACQDPRPQHQRSATITSGVAAQQFVVRRDFNDVDELGAVGRAWDLDFRQLNRGGFRGSVVQAGTSELQIARTRLCGVLHQQGSAPPGLRTFAVSAAGDINLQWRGHEVERNSILIFPPSRELESTSSPDFDMLLVSVTEDSLEAARHRLGIPGSEEAMAGLEIACCEGSALADLRRWIVRTLAALTQNPALRLDPGDATNAEVEASDLIVRALVTGRADAGHYRSVRRRRLVERAVRLARDNAQDIHSVAELSQKSGASHQTLRRGFRERFGVPPRAYLLAQRLDWSPPRTSLRNPTHTGHRRSQQLGILAHGTVRSRLPQDVRRTSVANAPTPEERL